MKRIVMALAFTVPTLLALVLVAPGPASADSDWTCTGRPGSGLVCGALGYATTDPQKTCIYPLTGNAPDVGPFPCAKYRHYVGTDRRAIFRPDPLSRFANRTNFGETFEEGNSVRSSAGVPAALEEAASRSGIEEQRWQQEIQAR